MTAAQEVRASPWGRLRRQSGNVTSPDILSTNRQVLKVENCIFSFQFYDGRFGLHLTCGKLKTENSSTPIWARESFGEVVEGEVAVGEHLSEEDDLACVRREVFDDVEDRGEHGHVEALYATPFEED